MICDHAEIFRHRIAAEQAKGRRGGNEFILVAIQGAGHSVYRFIVGFCTCKQERIVGNHPGWLDNTGIGRAGLFEREIGNRHVLPNGGQRCGRIFDRQCSNAVPCIGFSNFWRAQRHQESLGATRNESIGAANEARYVEGNNIIAGQAVGRQCRIDQRQDNLVGHIAIRHPPTLQVRDALHWRIEFDVGRDTQRKQDCDRAQPGLRAIREMTLAGHGQHDFILIGDTEIHLAPCDRRHENVCAGVIAHGRPEIAIVGRNLGNRGAGLVEQRALGGGCDARNFAGVSDQRQSCQRK